MSYVDKYCIESTEFQPFAHLCTMPRKKNIDATDIDLINELQADAGISNASLARKVNLSPGPTLLRVRALFEKGAINRPSCIINYGYFGFAYKSLVELVVSEKNGEDLKTRLVTNARCITVHKLKRQTPELDTSITYQATFVSRTRDSFIKCMSDWVLNIPYEINFRVYDIEEVLKQSAPIKLDTRHIG